MKHYTRKNRRPRNKKGKTGIIKLIKNVVNKESRILRTYSDTEARIYSGAGWHGFVHKLVNLPTSSGDETNEYSRTSNSIDCTKISLDVYIQMSQTGRYLTDYNMVGVGLTTYNAIHYFRIVFVRFHTKPIYSALFEITTPANYLLSGVFNIGSQFNRESVQVISDRVYSVTTYNPIKHVKLVVPKPKGSKHHIKWANTNAGTVEIQSANYGYFIFLDTSILTDTPALMPNALEVLKVDHYDDN